MMHYLVCWNTLLVANKNLFIYFNNSNSVAKKMVVLGIPTSVLLLHYYCITHLPSSPYLEGPSEHSEVGPIVDGLLFHPNFTVWAGN